MILTLARPRHSLREEVALVLDLGLLMQFYVPILLGCAALLWIAYPQYPWAQGLGASGCVLLLGCMEWEVVWKDNRRRYLRVLRRLQRRGWSVSLAEGAARTHCGRRLLRRASREAGCLPEATAFLDPRPIPWWYAVQGVPKTWQWPVDRSREGR